jgi:hypothetical protein
VGCNNVQSYRWISAFRRNKLSPCSDLECYFENVTGVNWIIREDDVFTTLSSVTRGKVELWKRNLSLFVNYLSMLPVMEYTASNKRWYGRRLSWLNLGTLRAFAWRYEEIQPAEPVFRPGFETRSFRIQIQRGTVWRTRLETRLKC